MFVKSMGDRFQKLLASTLTPEEKLAAITKEIEAQVQEKKVLARQIGAQMRAMADPDTKELEPLERLIVQREKLVKLGGSLVDDPTKMVELGQIQQKMKGLDTQLSSQQATYDTLTESYKVAKDNYNQALAALSQVRENAPAMLKAIQAHKDALALRDKAKSGKSIDVSFVDELSKELSDTQAELRSDKEIEDDLGVGGFNIDVELAKMDAATVDDSLRNEFRAAKK
jgi:hypothetical protein